MPKKAKTKFCPSFDNFWSKIIFLGQVWWRNYSAKFRDFFSIFHFHFSATSVKQVEKLFQKLNSMIYNVKDFSGLGSAVVMIFENRFNAMCPPYFRFKMNKRREYHCIMFVISFSLLISSFLRLEDQNSAKNSYINVRSLIL